jgi:hypothetical protein
MEDYLLIIVLLILAILVIAGFITYRSKGEAGFSIGNLIKFWFKGENIVEQPSRESPVPSPDLLFSLVNRKGEFVNNLDVKQRESVEAQDLVFKFGVNNNQESTVAKGIGIRVHFYWRGDMPEHSPVFQKPYQPNEWEVESASLKSDQPAILSFNEPSMVVFYNQPKIWGNFRLSTKEQLSGYFLVTYEISSANPPTTFKGEFKLQPIYGAWT